MHYPTALSILACSASLLTLTSALPTAADLVPRACATEYPSFITTIQEASPDTAYGNTQYTIAAQNANGDHEVDTLIAFTNIPANSYGCQLEFYAPAGYNIPSTGSTLLNVWATTRDVTPTDSWNNAPGKSYLFGSVTLSSQTTSSTKLVVNNLVCAPNLSFRVEIASETAFGQVEAAQKNPPADPAAGWRITHNC
ncbi:hypothetical protein MMC24_002941 [Lignoscripta atroalba]|nr:hypothetical protein [Lignoscripta atroalba]